MQFRDVAATVFAVAALGASNVDFSVQAAYVDEIVAPVSTFAGLGLHGHADGRVAQFNLPQGLAAFSDGLLVADTYNNMIRFVNWSSVTSTVTGEITGLDEYRFPRGFLRDGAIDGALFNRPTALAVNEAGVIFVADSANHVIRAITGGGVYTFSGSAQAGYLNGTATQAMFNSPHDIAIDSEGNLYIADSGNHVIRKIDIFGNVSTIAGRARTPGHNNGAAGEALFNSPMGIAVSQDGRIFVSDTGNHLIRVIEDGQVMDYAGTLVFANDIEFAVTYDVNEWDNIPLGGFSDGENAMFNLPRGLCLFGDTVIVADSANHRIRGIMSDGYVFTLAGSDYPGHNDGNSQDVSFHLPMGVHIVGNELFVADTNNNVIRKISMPESLRHGIEKE